MQPDRVGGNPVQGGGLELDDLIDLSNLSFYDSVVATLITIQQRSHLENQKEKKKRSLIAIWSVLHILTDISILKREG